MYKGKSQVRASSPTVCYYPREQESLRESKMAILGSFLPLPISLQQLSYIGNITSYLAGKAGNELERVDEDGMRTGGRRTAPCLCIEYE